MTHDEETRHALVGDVGTSKLPDDTMSHVKRRSAGTFFSEAMKRAAPEAMKVLAEYREGPRTIPITGELRSWLVRLARLHDVPVTDLVHVALEAGLSYAEEYCKRSLAEEEGLQAFLMQSHELQHSLICALGDGESEEER